MNKIKALPLTLAVAAFGFAFAATASSRIIVCAAGVHCDADVRRPCLQSGGSQALCDALWRDCVIDACQ